MRIPFLKFILCCYLFYITPTFNKKLSLLLFLCTNLIIIIFQQEKPNYRKICDDRFFFRFHNIHNSNTLCIRSYFQFSRFLSFSSFTKISFYFYQNIFKTVKIFFKIITNIKQPNGLY
jgi:hypothetical protein